MEREYSAALYPEQMKDLLALIDFVNVDQAVPDGHAAARSAARRLTEHIKNWQLGAALDAGKLGEATRKVLHFLDEGDYDVDDVPPVSAGADGCHVAAWIWVPYEEEEPEQPGR